MSNLKLRTMKTILETDYAIAEFFEEDELVQVTWKKISGKLPFEEYTKVFEESLKFQDKNKEKIKFFLSDIRQQSVLPPDYRKWFQENAMPKATENGIYRSGVLFEGNVFQKYYLNNILNTTKKFGVTMKFLSEREDALKWFKEQS